MSHKNREPLIIIHNPNSTDAAHFDELAYDLKQNDISYVDYETKSPDTEENIAHMQELLPDHGATVISAAGDGTAMQIMNAILRSRRQGNTTLGLVNYGGFSDLSHAHNDKRTTVMDVLQAPAIERQPLTVEVNGEYWRDAPAYVSLGFTALAAMEFGTPKSRRAMQQAPGFLKRPKSILQLGESYFEHHGVKLPSLRIDDEAEYRTELTDIMVANNPVIGGIIKLPENHYDTSHFGVRTDLDVSKILPNIPFGLQALAGRAPFSRAETLRITFERTAAVPIQTEGETAYLEEVHDIFVYKNPAKALRMLHPRGAER